MATTRGRIVQVNQIILDQADFFRSDGYTRVTGLGVPDITSDLFFSNVRQPWTLDDGSGVSDARIASGRVYFNEVPGSPGYYSVRFRPNAVGYWRLLITYVAGEQIVAQDYDVVPQVPVVAGNVKASFVKPGR